MGQISPVAPVFRPGYKRSREALAEISSAGKFVTKTVTMNKTKRSISDDDYADQLPLAVLKKSIETKSSALASEELLKLNEIAISQMKTLLNNNETEIH